jgi:hypothetical protein
MAPELQRPQGGVARQPIDDGPCARVPQLVLPVDKATDVCFSEYPSKETKGENK